VENKDLIIPYLSKPFVDWLSTKDLSSKTMVEFGAGKSTIYFSKKFKNVFSFEHDQEWIDLINSEKLKNVHMLKMREDFYMYGNYRNFIKNSDYVLIDNNPNIISRGFIASMCCEACLTKANIILDNSEDYQPAYTYLKGMYKNVEDFIGENFMNELTTTSLFYNELTI
tara:strand:- start:8805 stop:9311 length:507 start_codon:yes stop_codon:yes gene_type:complete